jgi:hypothetical protein
MSAARLLSSDEYQLIIFRHAATTRFTAQMVKNINHNACPVHVGVVLDQYKAVTGD